jgi:hypothetical protein
MVMPENIVQDVICRPQPDKEKFFLGFRKHF